MEKTILIKKENDDISAVVMENDRAVEYHKKNHNVLPRGTVVTGLVKNYAPHLDAYFVDIGEEKNGYLPVKLTDGKTTTGMILPLQVTREESGSKGAGLSARIYVTGRFVVAGNGMEEVRVSKKIEDAGERERLKTAIEGLAYDREIVMRTNSKGVPADVLKEDLKQSLEVLTSIEKTSSKPGSVLLKSDGIASKVMHRFKPGCDRVYFNDIGMYEKYKNMYRQINMDADIRMYSHEYDMYDFFNVSGQLKRAMQKRVRLKSGGGLVFDYTEAMCVIDVNSASGDSAPDAASTARVTNLEAAGEIAIQLRLRNIGGIVVIDFIQMDKPEMEKLDLQFKEYLKSDKGRIQIGGFTALGNYELIRKRRGPAIHEHQRQG